MTLHTPKTRAWYTSQAVADRTGYAIVFTTVDSVGRLWMSFQRPDSEVELSTPWRDVTGRSAAHIDRLARDWIGHGVAPTQRGERGVRSPRRRACIVRGRFVETHGKATRDRKGGSAWISDGAADLQKWDRDEARAKRVVAL
jgi:hypothetical protein